MLCYQSRYTSEPLPSAGADLLYLQSGPAVAGVHSFLLFFYSDNSSSPRPGCFSSYVTYHWYIIIRRVVCSSCRALASRVAVPFLRRFSRIELQFALGAPAKYKYRENVSIAEFCLVHSVIAYGYTQSTNLIHPTYGVHRLRFDTNPHAGAWRSYSQAGGMQGARYFRAATRVALCGQDREAQWH